MWQDDRMERLQAGLPREEVIQLVVSISKTAYSNLLLDDLRSALDESLTEEQADVLRSLAMGRTRLADALMKLGVNDRKFELPPDPTDSLEKLKAGIPREDAITLFGDLCDARFKELRELPWYSSSFLERVRLKYWAAQDDSLKADQLAGLRELLSKRVKKSQAEALCEAAQGRITVRLLLNWLRSGLSWDEYLIAAPSDFAELLPPIVVDLSKVTGSISIRTASITGSAGRLPFRLPIARIARSRVCIFFFGRSRSTPPAQLYTNHAFASVVLLDLHTKRNHL